MELCIHYRPVAEEASGWSRGSTWPTAVSTWDRSLRSPGRGVGAVWSEGWACCKAKSTLHLAGSAVVPCTIHSHFSSQSLCHLPSLSISDINGVQPSVNEPLEVARTSQNVLNLLGKKKKKKCPRPEGVILKLGLTRIKVGEHILTYTEVCCVCRRSSTTWISKKLGDGRNKLKWGKLKILFDKHSAEDRTKTMYLICFCISLVIEGSTCIWQASANNCTWCSLSCPWSLSYWNQTAEDDAQCFSYNLTSWKQL